MSPVRSVMPDPETYAIIAEYTALRAEIIQRVTNQLTIVGGNIALLTLAFASFREEFGRGTMSFELLLAPMIFMVVAWWFFQQDMVIAQAASYLHKTLRPAVEARLNLDVAAAGQTLSGYARGVLAWESHRTEKLFGGFGSNFERLDPLFRLAATLGPGIAVMIFICIVAWSRPEFYLSAGPIRIALFWVDCVLLVVLAGLPWHVAMHVNRHITDEKVPPKIWFYASLGACIVPVGLIVLWFAIPQWHPENVWPQTSAKLAGLLAAGERDEDAFSRARRAASGFALAHRREPAAAVRGAAARAERARLETMYVSSAQEFCKYHDYIGMMSDIYGAPATDAARRALHDVELSRTDGLRTWRRALDMRGDATDFYERAAYALERSEVAAAGLEDALQTVSHRLDGDVRRLPADVSHAFARRSSCGTEPRYAALLSP